MTTLCGIAFAIGTVALAIQAPILLDSEERVIVSEEVYSDPATSIEFPERLRIPSKAHLPEVTLLGAGVRKVSFLRVKVYSIGFYADLNNPRIKFTSDMTPEQKIEHVVDNTTCLIRIVPVRTTNFTHLRDAFVRALYQRLSIAQKNQVMFSQEEIYNITTGISSVRTLFPNRTLEKGTPLDIVVTPPMPDNPRALIFRDLGAVMGSWVTTEFVLHYFSQDAPSPPLKAMVTSAIAAKAALP